jgi:hypothetical protein
MIDTTRLYNTVSFHARFRDFRQPCANKKDKVVYGHQKVIKRGAFPFILFAQFDFFKYVIKTRGTVDQKTLFQNHPSSLDMCLHSFIYTVSLHACNLLRR